MKPEEVRQALLSAVGYQSPAPTCYACQFYSEREDPMLDRSWLSECNQFGKAGPISITKQAVCKSFEQKRLEP